MLLRLLRPNYACLPIIHRPLDQNSKSPTDLVIVLVLVLVVVVGGVGVGVGVVVGVVGVVGVVTHPIMGIPSWE